MQIKPTTACNLAYMQQKNIYQDPIRMSMVAAMQVKPIKQQTRITKKEQRIDIRI